MATRNDSPPQTGEAPTGAAPGGQIIPGPAGAAGAATTPTRPAVSKAVLVTGCSSGIGQATARYLAERGWRVYATARSVAALENLRQVGCRLLELDVTDEASMRAAVATVEDEEGAVGVLVNNAGYSQSGAIESVPMDRVRRQFETNLFGPVRLTQLVLPGMRRQRWGKIVNLSSMGGRLTFPGGGYYHATKHAVEALTDALRFEVAGFGVDAILIEPGLIRTHFGATAAESVGGSARASGDGASGDDVYREFNETVARVTQETYSRGPLARLGTGPEAVAKTIDRAISSARPRARYTTDAAGRLLLTLHAILPDRMWDRFLGGQFPQPG
jgi:NAD(P)-dependent dehydrogenase (short-subunit alcohol dehydrogenase family)